MPGIGGMVISRLQGGAIMQDMTIKEIAGICNVEERTVQLWAKKAGENISSVAEIISSAGHGKPATFTLPETIAIIKAGGRSTLADLLQGERPLHA